MTTDLQSKEGTALFAGFVPLARSVLRAVDAHQFVVAKAAFDEVETAAAKIKESQPSEALLNDLWIIRAYFRLFREYSELWEQIIQERFSASWGTLQDALDSIRAIKRVSEVDVKALEIQLTNLEKAYPYKLFASIGAVASRIECSICGQDIDSFECIHRRGQLYAGVMACSILRDFKSLDHVSLVTSPEDKRCVLSYEDNSHHFVLTRYLAKHIRERVLLISEFDDIKFSKKTMPNPAYRNLGRNDPCFCGSGKKFKRCCLGKTSVEKDHAEICARRTIRIPEPISSAN